MAPSHGCSAVRVKCGRRQWHLPEQRLSEESVFFRHCLRGTFRDPNDKVVELNDVDERTVGIILNWICPPKAYTRSGLLKSLQTKLSFRVLLAADRLVMDRLMTDVCEVISRQTVQLAHPSKASHLSASLGEISRLPHHLRRRCNSTLVRTIAESSVPNRVAATIEAGPLQRYIRDDPDLAFQLCRCMANRLKRRVQRK
ncbi:hypothetical protein GJ744_007828 [Endocarpon pusillum]|uniref:BTB domain-containing protein n=1 Tax=Endocarpon pusillum TaxID=364733 RepID=A0A8H7E929_9EURO|nr:hypothetical protein GJ744_007828 [Endocarpon pusillum]